MNFCEWYWWSFFKRSENDLIIITISWIHNIKIKKIIKINYIFQYNIDKTDVDFNIWKKNSLKSFFNAAFYFLMFNLISNAFITNWMIWRKQGIVFAATFQSIFMLFKQFFRIDCMIWLIFALFAVIPNNRFWTLKFCRVFKTMLAKLTSMCFF